MSNDYKVRPMGADPRTSLTITDDEIIYRNGLIGSHEKRVALQDARVSFSTLMKGGKITVREFGQEIFSVDGILNPKAFMTEFEGRKNGGAQASIAKSPTFNGDIPVIRAYSSSEKVTSIRNFAESLGSYQYKGEELKVNEIIRNRIAEQACKEIRDRLDDDFTRLEKSFLVGTFNNVSMIHSARDVVIEVPSMYFTQNRNPEMQSAQAKIYQAMSTAYEQGEHDSGSIYTHTKEAVFGFGKRAVGVAYHPETGTSSCIVYKHEDGAITPDAEAYQGYGIMHYDDLDGAIENAKQIMGDTLRQKKHLVKFNICAAGIILAGILGATVAFGEEAPANNDLLQRDLTDYTILIEP